MFQLDSKKNIQIHLTGLPRFCRKRLPYFRRAVSRNSLISGTFWDIHAVSQKEIQTAGPSMAALQKYVIGTVKDWAQIELTCNKFTKIPIEKYPNLDDMKHNLIDLHNLRVSSQSVLSWMNAIYYAVEFLCQENIEEDKLVFLSRSDLKINPILLKSVLTKLEKKSLENTIYLGKRMGKHLIYPTKYGTYKELPVDHFFVAKFKDISKLRGLKNYLDNYLSEKNHSVPLVAEFLLADFMELVGLEWRGVDLPYVIWRGSYLKSITSPFSGVSMKRLPIHFIYFYFWKIFSFTKSLSQKL
jgi:hypothetical protein